MCAHANVHANAVELEHCQVNTQRQVQSVHVELQTQGFLRVCHPEKAAAGRPSFPLVTSGCSQSVLP